MILAAALFLFGLTAGIWLGRAYALKAIVGDIADLERATGIVFKEGNDNRIEIDAFHKKAKEYGIKFNGDDLTIVRGSVAHLAQIESSGSE